MPSARALRIPSAPASCTACGGATGVVRFAGTAQLCSAFAQLLCGTLPLCGALGLPEVSFKQFSSSGCCAAGTAVREYLENRAGTAAR